MDKILIGGYYIPYPNGFTMKKVVNKVNEVTTVSGKTIADVNGWKYENATLSWDTLLESDLSNLLSAISASSFSITFEDIDGAHTVTALLESRVNTKTRFRYKGEVVWKGISVEVSFPDCYQS